VAAQRVVVDRVSVKGMKYSYFRLMDFVTENGLATYEGIKSD